MFNTQNAPLVTALESARRIHTADSHWPAVYTLQLWKDMINLKHQILHLSSCSIIVCLYNIYTWATQAKATKANQRLPNTKLLSPYQKFPDVQYPGTMPLYPLYLETGLNEHPIPIISIGFSTIKTRVNQTKFVIRTKEQAVKRKQWMCIYCYIQATSRIDANLSPPPHNTSVRSTQNIHFDECISVISA